MRVALEGEVNGVLVLVTVFVSVSLFVFVLSLFYFCALTKGGKQEKIKKPRREGEEQASFLVNFLIQVILKSSLIVFQIHFKSDNELILNSYQSLPF